MTRSRRRRLGTLIGREKWTWVRMKEKNSSKNKRKTGKNQETRRERCKYEAVAERGEEKEERKKSGRRMDGSGDMKERAWGRKVIKVTNR